MTRMSKLKEYADKQRIIQMKGMELQKESAMLDAEFKAWLSTEVPAFKAENTQFTMPEILLAWTEANFEPIIKA